MKSKVINKYFNEKPKLTVVIVCYNMARELPRTLQSLSMCIHSGLTADEIEVIVVDNGSSSPVDIDSCCQWIPDMQLVGMENPNQSPVNAINKGLELAHGDFIGVMVDGARMLSPGLLNQACNASKLHDRAVVGTFAFHLGPDVQMRSVAEGYNQQKEDKLLESSNWESDGYHLFEISTFAGASSQGWFELPNETNALFMNREQWVELGGYESKFVTPGGGLCNHDMWHRACSDSRNQVVMLLGEATFHQVHGGVATNAVESKRELFHEEYRSIRGHQFRKSKVDAHLFGRFHPSILNSLEHSIDKATRRAARHKAAA